MQDDLVNTQKRPIYQLIMWIGSNPIVIGVVILLITSSVGFVYERSLFGQFDINIFRFSSVYDFMYQWWRQWAVVSYFLVMLLQMAGMILGYWLAVTLVDSSEQGWFGDGDLTLGERMLTNINQKRLRGTVLFVISIIILFVMSVLVVKAGGQVLAGKGIGIAAIYSVIYGAFCFMATWLGQSLLINNNGITIWRFTGITLLVIGLVYLFTMLLVNVSKIAETEAKLLMRDTRYTYTVVRNDGSREQLVSRDAKILAVTTYYHLFYVRESGKVVAVNNQNISMVESNWVR